MKLSDLHGHPANPRRITDDKLKMLKKSLDEFGDLSGFVFNVRTKRLSGGHQRKKVIPDDAEVWMEERMTQPTRTGTVGHGYVIHDGEKYACRFVDWDELKEKAANIAANHHGGEDEPSALADFLLDLDANNYDLELTGLTHEEIEDICAPYRTMPEEDEDAIPATPATAKTKRGELWLLGEHRLLIDDCTVKENVERLMNGEKANLWITDPPYGVSYADKNAFLNTIAPANRIQERIANDHHSVEDMAPFWEAAAKSALSVCDDESPYYWFACQGGDQMMMMMMSISNAGWKVRHELIWVKNNHVLGRCDYHYKHEPILYGWKKEGTHRWFGNASHFSVLNFDKPQKSDLHPTMKPIELISYLIGNSSQANSIILDTFLGSGSTLIACEKTGRKCYGCEIDPQYGDVIIERWQKFTGKEAVREDGVKFNELT